MTAKPWTYRARLRRVIDGDTMELHVDLGFGVTHRLTVRLAGIDTPEPRAKDPAERLRAHDATEAARDWFRAAEADAGDDWPLLITTAKAGKYGRWIADIDAAASPPAPFGFTLTDHLLTGGHQK